MRLPRRLSFESIEARRLLAVVDIPDNLQGLPQQQVVSPVNIDNASGVRGAEIHLRYDPAVLTITTSQIVAGSVWGNNPNVQVVANIDATAGTIAVFVSGAEGLPTGAGSLVNFNFVVREGAAAGSTTVLNLTDVRLNEGTITVSPAPQPGADTTDGLITIGGGTDNSISGRVYADVNLNNTPDPTEGIPSVTITLINTATNAQTTVTTSATGEFQFTNLAAGNYRIQQKQPVAFINGGPNELTVTLVTGQAITGQNFRELGLRPEYVYNRLFTTLVMPVGSTAWTNTISQIVTDAENSALQVTPASTASTLSALQSTEEIVTPPANDSAGEQIETGDSNSPLSAGEAIDEAAETTDDAIVALADSWDDSNAEELPLDDHDEALPPADQDALLLSLLASDDTDSASTLFDS